MDNIPTPPAGEWAIPDDAGFEAIRARFRKKRKNKRRTLLVAIVLLSTLAWGSIVMSLEGSNDRNALLTFEHDRLETILPQIERLYDINIELADKQLGKLKFSGTFRQERPEKILNVLGRSLKFTYTRSGAHHYTIERR